MLDISCTMIDLEWKHSIQVRKSRLLHDISCSNHQFGDYYKNKLDFL